MKLLDGIKFVYETKDGETRVFKAVKVDGSKEEVLDVSAIATEGYKIIFEKEDKIFGRKADGTEEQIDVSKFLA